MLKCVQTTYLSNNEKQRQQQKHTEFLNLCLKNMPMEKWVKCAWQKIKSLYRLLKLFLPIIHPGKYIIKSIYNIIQINMHI